MQTHFASINLSANNSVEPSGNSASINDSHIPPLGPGSAVAAVDGDVVPKENLASPSGITHSCFCPLSSTNSKEIFESFGSLHKIPASEAMLLPDLVPITCNCDVILHHAEKIQNATSDEISVIHLVSLVGISAAILLAAKLKLGYRDCVLRLCRELFP